MKWAWLMWVQHKKERKTKGKGEWAELIGLRMKNNNTNNDTKSS